MGLGHLIRCTALADALCSNFEMVSFNCVDIPESVANEIKLKGYEVNVLMNELDFLEQITPDHVVVLDGYNFTYQEELNIKNRSHKVITIDDLHARNFCSDVVVNHAPSATEAHYEELEHQNLLLGEKFSLLRGSFIRIAQSSPSKNGYLVVCVGGSDSLGLTLSIVNELLEFKGVEVKVILGPSFIDTESLKTLLLQNEENFEILSSLSETEMAKVIKEAEYAIVPSSGIMMESVSCSCKLLTFWYVENQNELHDYMVHRFGSLSFGDNREQFNRNDFAIGLKELIKLEMPKETDMKSNIGTAHESFQKHLIPLLL